MFEMGDTKSSKVWMKSWGMLTASEYVLNPKLYLCRDSFYGLFFLKKDIIDPNGIFT